MKSACVGVLLIIVIEKCTVKHWNWSETICRGRYKHN